MISLFVGALKTRKMIKALPKLLEKKLSSCYLCMLSIRTVDHLIANCDRNYFSDTATHGMTRKYVGHTDVLLELIRPVNQIRQSIVCH